MKMRILSVMLVVVLFSCNRTTDIKNLSPILNVEPDTISEIGAKTNSIDSTVFKLPILGALELSNMKVEKERNFQMGDCWGVIKKYAMPSKKLVIDSLRCGEHGYSYSFYQLDPQDRMQVLYRREAESVIDDGLNEPYFVRKESVTDLRPVKPVLLMRVDTVRDRSLMGKQVNKPFVESPLGSKPETLKNLREEYLKAWDREERELWQWEAKGR